STAARARLPRPPSPRPNSSTAGGVSRDAPPAGKLLSWTKRVGTYRHAGPPCVTGWPARLERPRRGGRRERCAQIVCLKRRHAAAQNAGSGMVVGYVRVSRDRLNAHAAGATVTTCSPPCRPHAKRRIPTASGLRRTVLPSHVTAAPPEKR